MINLYKLGKVPDSLSDELSDEYFEYPNIWAKEKTSGPDRLVIAPRSDYVQLLGKLAESTAPPFLLLYVLAIPRGGSEPGRYQSNYSFSLPQLQHFLSDYSEFLENDARHNLWIRSDDGMLVYDRHNVIYAYGPLERFVAVLESSGLTESTEVRFPSPHAHHYNPEFDADEKRILHDEEWTIRGQLEGGQSGGERHYPRSCLHLYTADQRRLGGRGLHA
jgi:hypothetical protein